MTKRIVESSIPRVSFGMIVFNGEPFLRYNIRALYPFAHQILIVEGACRASRAYADTYGHSTDGTLDTLRIILAEEDPENKLTIITAAEEGYSDGFWPEKDEMSQAYARRATGEYLWQVDCDEFYHAADMREVLQRLAQFPDIRTVTFPVIQFWGGLAYRTDGFYLRRGAGEFRRVFAWGRGYRYVTHRPPTITDADGRDLSVQAGLTAGMLRSRGVYLYHYSFLFPFQIQQKFAYHDSLNAAAGLPMRIRQRRRRWLDGFQTLRSPFMVDDTSVVSGASWLRRFDGNHPAAIRELWKDLESGRLAVQMRRTDDIERLLSSIWYGLRCRVLESLTPLVTSFWASRKTLTNFVRSAAGLNG